MGAIGRAAACGWIWLLSLNTAAIAGDDPLPGAVLDGPPPKSQPLVPDLDSDGHVDLCHAAYGDVASDLVVRMGDGAGGFTAPVHVLTGPLPGPSDVKAADMDGDGDLDILYEQGGTLSIAWNDGTGGLVPSAALSVSPYTETLHAGDVDGDGDCDVLVFSDTVSDRLEVLLNGAGTLSLATTVLLEQPPYSVSARAVTFGM